MKTFSILTLIFMTSLAQNTFAAKKPNIIIVATGGTIAGQVKSSGSAEYTSAQLSAESLIAAVPQLATLANISAVQFSQVGSQDMSDELLLKLAKKISEILEKKSVDGVVITHGTDTIEETAYFLNLTVKTKKPVVLVGAMRPANSLSADGPLNLYDAVAVAASADANGKGALVVFNGEIFAARDVTKTNTTNVAAFKGGDFGALGLVHFGDAKFYHATLRRHTSDSDFDAEKISKLPKVAILYGYGFDQSGVIDQLVSEGVKGIVFAGVGDGNMNKETLAKLADVSKEGVAVVRSSRTGSGFVVRNSEINDDDFGFVVADNLNPQKARILLAVALTKTGDHRKIQEIFWEF